MNGSAQQRRVSPPPALAGIPSDPRVVVRQARIDVLAEALTDGAAHGFMRFGGDTFFRCPRCRKRSFNTPTAQVASSTTWWCRNCNAHGTRYELERRVLEDADAIEALLRIVAEYEDGYR